MKADDYVGETVISSGHNRPDWTTGQAGKVVSVCRDYGHDLLLVEFPKEIAGNRGHNGSQDGRDRGSMWYLRPEECVMTRGPW